ncbi:MAG: phytanoyl-CoA dioxygenase family protein, partial [Nocardioidaceae bacterium]
FNSHTVHRALPNTYPDRVRLSCDFRYQPREEPLTDGSLRVHCDVLSWDEVYAGWPAGGIQWYWRDLPLQQSDWDEGLRWQKDRIC